jgi:hypothetical protein
MLRGPEHGACRPAQYHNTYWNQRGCDCPVGIVITLRGYILGTGKRFSSQKHLHRLCYLHASCSMGAGCCFQGDKAAGK